MERHFRPEFLNRVDEIIVFQPARRARTCSEIIDIETRGLSERLAQRKVEIVLTEAAKEFIIEKGFNPEYGARPLRRAIQRLLEDPLAEEVLRGHFPEGTRILVSLEGEEIAFKTERIEAEPPPETGGTETEAEEPVKKEG